MRDIIGLNQLRPPELHIPDGFLSLTISFICWVVTLVFLGLAVRRTQTDLGERQIPLMGVMAAFIFAAQMINFTIPGGTSGHLIGGTLAAVALGPWAAMLVMASVIGVQALLFQDGGLLVLGANILNMGILPALIGFGLYRGVTSQRQGVRLTVAGVAAWLSVMAAALATSLQLWLSGTSRLDIVIPAMLSVHAIIGIGEALITVAALAFILRTRPDLLAPEQYPAGHGRVWVGAGLLISLAVVLLSPYASAYPDGLERVAEDLGFLDRGQSAPYEILPDYTIPGLDGGLSTILSGLIGVLVVAGLAVLIVRLIRRPRPNDEVAVRPGRQSP